MNPDSRAPSSRPFGSRLGRPPMTRSHRNTLSASHPPVDPFRLHNLNVQLCQDEESSGGRTQHTEGLRDCRCVACHLKTQVFPRRQDGRIVLPAPWLLTPQQVSSSSLPPPRISTPQPRGLGERQAHVPNVREPRMRAGSSSWVAPGHALHIGQMVDINTDRGEGSSQIVRQLSGVAPLDGLVETSVLPAHIHQGAQPSSGIPRVTRQDKRSHRPDRAKSLRIFKPYEKPIDRSELPDPSTLELRLAHEHPDSSVMLLPPYPSREELRTRKDNSRSDSYEHMQYEQFPRILEPAGQFGYHSGYISGASSSNPSIPHHSQVARVTQSGIGASGHVSPSPSGYSPWNIQQIDESTQATSSERRVPHSLQSGHSAPHQTHSLQISEESQVYRFSSRSHNPQPSMSQPTTLANPAHFDPALRSQSPTSNISQAAPAESSFSWHAERDEQGSVRFQEPVVPEDLSGSPNHQREQLAIKWDSERKRRQGYFAQDAEGEEKSNFRHYNKSKIDFGN